VLPPPGSQAGFALFVRQQLLTAANRGPFLMQKIVVAILAAAGLVLCITCAMGALRTGVVVIPRGRGYSNLRVNRRLQPGFFWIGVGLWDFWP
jgi:hypothetical protein